MLDLRGKGAMTAVNLVARVYDNNTTKDGKTQYADIQVDHRDPRGQGKTDLHLRSERVPNEGGGPKYNNNAPYSTNQMDQIKQAAGQNMAPIMKDERRIGTVYGFKGNVMPASRGRGLVVNTKTLQPSDFKVDSTTLDKQFAAVREANDAKTKRAVSDLYRPDGPLGAAHEVEQTATAEEPAPG